MEFRPGVNNYEVSAFIFDMNNKNIPAQYRLQQIMFSVPLCILIRTGKTSSAVQHSALVFIHV